MLRVLFGAALVLRLLVDMATPLLPGAFRFDPAESVEAHRQQPVRIAAETNIRPSAAPSMTVDAIVRPRHDLSARALTDHRPPVFRPLLARHATGVAPDTAEDH